MSVSTSRYAGLVAAAILLGGCNDTASFTGPGGSVLPLSPSLQRTGDGAEAPSVDSEFARLAQEEIPGFAGYYWDSAGNLHMLLTETAPQSPAAEALLRVLANRQLGQARPLPEAASVRAHRVRYDFAQLDGWRAHARTLLSVQGVQTLDTDELRNRIVVGVDDDAARGRVERALTLLPIPRSAVVIEQADPLMVYPNSCGADAISCDSGGTSGSSGTLQDRVSPRRGGVLILHDLFAGDGIVNGCTLGLAVRLWGVARFLTNSHCTKTKGSVDPNYLYYQGTYGNYYDLVGREWSDPAWFGCQWSSKCRRSDAAFIEFQTADYQFAKIAEPTTPNTSSITVDRFSNFTVTHEWQVPMEMPVVGKRLHRVGSSTGWTYGNVSHTCQDLRDPDGSALICQYLVATDVTSKVGDSGAPVFFIPNLAPSEDPDGAGAPRDVWIYGLHNGSTTEGLAVFSFWESIQVELGDITLQ